MRCCSALLSLAGSLALVLASPAGALDLIVDSAEDDGSGGLTLREAIGQINDIADTTNTISFHEDLAGDVITLLEHLPPILNDVSIDGSEAPGLTIDGDDLYRIFSVSGADVSIEKLSLANGRAQGGDGASRGGGGLGAGGGLLVDRDASVTLVDVAFDGMQASGGAGGAHDTVSGGGGGGFVRAGGSGSSGGAGGGGGVDGDGGAGSDSQGGDGGGLNGGLGGASGVAGGDAGFGGGGGGAGPGGADGGAGGEFGGGGGASGSGTGGPGGFGGGGGGASASGTGGEGGFGGGAGASDGQGDGGSGLGGAIFVREGGQLEILFSNDPGAPTDLGSHTVTAGAGATPGLAEGTDLYVMSGVDARFSVDELAEVSVYGDIAGEGGITKEGDGTLTLEGDNSYQGGTTVSGGTLVIVDLGTLPGDVTNDSVVRFDIGASKEYAGEMTGSGALEKQGAGTLTLSGDNGYQGGTTVSDGTLEIVDSGTLPGDVTNNSVVRFDIAGTKQYAGDMTGSGTLEKQGAGTLTLSGDNSAFGGTLEIALGTLRSAAASLPGVVVNDALLVFDQGVAGSYAGSISGSGSLRKEGGGTLVLAGSHDYSGGTSVAAGELQLDGSLNNPSNQVTVESGGVLSGEGTIVGEVLVQAGGRLSPGPSIKTLHTGSVQFEAGSFYSVDLDPGSPASDQLDVTGTATLAGGLVEVQLPGDPGLDPGSWVDYTILTASSGGIVSGFSGVSEELAFYDTTLAHDGTNLTLTLTRNFETLETIAETPNQQAVGEALEAASPPPPGSDLEAALDPFNGLSVAETRDALDAIGGEGLSSFTTAQIANAEAFARSVSSRLGVVSGRAIGSAGGAGLLPALQLGSAWRSGAAPFGSAGLLAAPAPAVSSPPPGEGKRFGLWVDGVGLFGDVEGDGNSADTRWVSGGGFLGIDYQIGRHGLLGIAGGYSRVHAEVDERAFEGDADVYQGGLYGAWVGERLFLSGLGRYAYVDYETRRRIAYGDLSRSAKADFRGHEAGGYVEAGYVAFAPARIQIEPVAAFHYLWLQRDGFSESGADSLDLEVGEQSWHSAVVSGGLRLHRSFSVDAVEGLRIRPELRLRYGYELGDRERRLEARVTGAETGGAFRISGASVARGGLVLGAGWTVLRAGDMGLYLHYDANLNSDLVAHFLTLGWVVRW